MVNKLHTVMGVGLDKLFRPQNNYLRFEAKITTFYCIQNTQVEPFM